MKNGVELRIRKVCNTMHVDWETGLQSLSFGISHLVRDFLCKLHII